MPLTVVPTYKFSTYLKLVPIKIASDKNPLKHLLIDFFRLYRRVDKITPKKQ